MDVLDLLVLSAFVFSPAVFFADLSTLFLRSGHHFHLTAPSFPLTSGERYSVMQLFAILLLTANLAVPALAAPCANAEVTKVTSSCDPGFLCGTQVGQGGLINHSVYLTFDYNES